MHQQAKYYPPVTDVFISGSGPVHGLGFLPWKKVTPHGGLGVFTAEKVVEHLPVPSPSDNHPCVGGLAVEVILGPCDPCWEFHPWLPFPLPTRDAAARGSHPLFHIVYDLKYGAAVFVNKCLHTIISSDHDFTRQLHQSA